MKLYLYTNAALDIPKGSVICGASKPAPRAGCALVEIDIDATTAKPFKVVAMDLPKGDWYLFPAGKLNEKANRITAAAA